MAFRLIGKDFTPPDLEAKVTGKAKYAEDFRADGMVFVKLFPSPMPHAKVKSIDPALVILFIRLAMAIFEYFKTRQAVSLESSESDEALLLASVRYLEDK